MGLGRRGWEPVGGCGAGEAVDAGEVGLVWFGARRPERVSRWKNRC